MPDNREAIVKTLNAKDHSKRVLIIHRPDGYYSIRPESWDTLEYEDVSRSLWLPIDLHSGIYATIEIVEKEACAEYPWAKGESECVE
jgi:hypothetical protein